MSTTFLERLRQNTLTDSDQYRKINNSVAEADKPLRAPVNEDWKRWDLLPVTSGPYATGADQSQHSTDVASSVQRAMARLED